MCQLPAEMVDVEVKVKMMQGIHTFRRDRTSQVIKCNPWSTKLCILTPPLSGRWKPIWELEGRLGPKSRPQPQTQPQQTQLQQSLLWPAQPSTNPMVRKTARTQNKCLWQEKKNHDSQKKVQGESTHPAYTFHPNFQLHLSPHM